MRLALWIALLVPIAAMFLGLKTKKFTWNCVLTLSCAAIILCTKRGAVMYPLVAALIASVVGDFFMARKSGRPMWYVYGIVGFLLAHLGFMWYSASRFAGSPRIYIAGAALVGMIVWYLAARVLPKIKDNKILRAAVGVYSVVSALSVVFAAGLQGTNQFETLLYGVGVACIAFSDTMIAENDFVGNKEWANFIMPTYYLCHILVAASAVVGIPV